MFSLTSQREICKLINCIYCVKILFLKPLFGAIVHIKSEIRDPGKFSLLGLKLVSTFFFNQVNYMLIVCKLF